jgi:hypothetical protein
LPKVAPPAPPLPDQIAAIARTPGATGGHEFASLLVEAEAESRFTVSARNPSTGAAGPFQFIATTWLAMVRKYGEGLGVKPELVHQIVLDHNGSPKVANPADRSQLLELRHDPVLATRIAAKYLDEGKAFLQHALGRAPSESEVHLTFLLGPYGASQLIKAADTTPNVSVDGVVGAAARYNKTLFQTASGEPRTAREALTFLAERYHADKARVAAYAKIESPMPARKFNA